jgi:hypothetical protein
MMKKKTFSFLLVAAFICAGPLLPPGRQAVRQDIASAQEDWKREFDDVCSRTQDSMTMSDDDLKSLIARCDALKPVMEKLEESQRKVYVKRLSMCRELFSFALGSRRK